MLERIVEILPAFDKRSKDPSKDCGIGAVQFKFLVKGSQGAIQFAFLSGIYLPSVREKFIAEHKHLPEPMAIDIGYHSYKPMYDGQKSISDSCPYLDGAECYYDGSTLNAERYFNIMIVEGHEALWSALEKEYNNRFGEDK